MTLSMEFSLRTAFRGKAALRLFIAALAGASAAGCSGSEPALWPLKDKGGTPSQPALISLDGPTGGVVARVNGRVITDWELEQEIPPKYRDRSQLPEAERHQVPVIRRRALQLLVEKRVLVDAAEAESIKIPENEVDDEIRQEREQAGLDSEAFKKQKETLSGRPYALYLERVREDLMVNELIRRRLSGGILFVPPRRIREKFQGEPAAFMEEDAVTFQRIVVSSREAGGAAEAQALAAAVRRQLDHGADFIVLARTYGSGADSEGRVYENVLRGTLPDAVEQAVFAAPPGSVTPPLPYHGDWAIFKVLSRRERRLKPFEDARLQQGIGSEEFNAAFNAKRREMINELMRKASIDPPDLFSK